MSTKDAYKQKIEAEMELAQARLDEFKAHVKSKAADVHIKYEKEISKLESKIDDTKSKLSELSASGEDAWDHLKESIEKKWKDVSDTSKNLIESLKK